MFLKHPVKEKSLKPVLARTIILKNKDWIRYKKLSPLIQIAEMKSTIYYLSKASVRPPNVILPVRRTPRELGLLVIRMTSSSTTKLTPLLSLVMDTLCQTCSASLRFVRNILRPVPTFSLKRRLGKLLKN